MYTVISITSKVSIKPNLYKYVIIYLYKLLLIYYFGSKSEGTLGEHSS